MILIFTKLCGSVRGGGEECQSALVKFTLRKYLGRVERERNQVFVQTWDILLLSLEENTPPVQPPRPFPFQCAQLPVYSIDPRAVWLGICGNWTSFFVI